MKYVVISGYTQCLKRISISVFQNFLWTCHQPALSFRTVTSPSLKMAQMCPWYFTNVCIQHLSASPPDMHY